MENAQKKTTHDNELADIEMDEENEGSQGDDDEVEKKKEA